MPRIHVTIPKKGPVKIEAEGFLGESCLDATRALEKALGLAQDRVEKPELYIQEQDATLEAQA